MKAIIFDLDDTLIKWKKEYIHNIYNYMNDLGYDLSYELCNKISNLVDINEKNGGKLDKYKLLDFINKELNIKLDINYMNDFITSFITCSYKDEKLKEVLNYLSSKYDLYVITNWFTESQKLRLEYMKILEYFKDVIGADKNYLKPNEKAYDIILDKYNASDCISVGDNLENDIIIPAKLGMDTYWVINNVSDNYKCIKTVYELKEIL